MDAAWVEAAERQDPTSSCTGTWSNGVHARTGYYHPMRPILLVRYGIPILLAIAGVVLIVIGGDAPLGAGITLLGIAVIVLVRNAFARISISSQDDRDREEAARETFTRTGRWPR